MKEDVGLATLQAERGVVPTGVGVSVSMAEASPSGNYAPMTDLPEFTGKHFEFRSNVTGNSWHATAVAQYFFGLTGSIAPAINSIEVYDANPYIAADFLRAGSSSQEPNRSPQNSRIGNHSWISNGTDLKGTLDILEREDWIVERDDFIQVVGVNNGDVNTNPLMSNAMNVIAVGISSGIHATSTLPLDGIYTGYRTRPDIVAPMPVTSFSTPLVSGASALLVQVAHTNPSLSTAWYAPPRFPGTGIYHGETSEVVKAALMAGASRLAFNSDATALLDYRAATSRQSNNGLDKRFGSGQLNVHNSFNVIASGEQNSTADGGPASVSPAGFDYDPHFGGSAGSNATATYDFTAGWSGQTLTASLVWNAKIDINKVKQGDHVAAATLYDLNLSLYDLTAPAPVLVASSTSGNQNTENIWTSLVGGRRYRLEVTRATSQPPFDWDYGLAWSTLGTIGWHGAPTNVWTEAPSLSWTKGSSTAGFLPGEHVVFGDWGVNGQVVLVGTVNPGSIVVENRATPYTFTGVGTIAGATGIVKRGAGLLSISTSNTYAGVTAIQGGRLAVHTNGALGLTAQGTTVSTGAALVFPGGVNYFLPEPLTISGQGSSGAGAIENSGDNFFAGPVSNAGNATIGVGAGNLVLLGPLKASASTVLEKNGLGTLSLRGGIDWGASSTVKVMAGTTRLEPAAGSPVTVSQGAPSLTVTGGAARVNAGGQDPFTDTQNPALHVNVTNNVTGGLVIEAGTATLNELTGTGTTLVAAGAHLSVGGIDQSGLSIATGGRVTLRPGTGTSVVKLLSFDAFVAGTPDLLLAESNSLTPAPTFNASAPAVDVGGAGANAIPEPSSVALAAGAVLALLTMLYARRRGRFTHR